MKRHLPSLNAIKCFDVVATHLSIKKAALDLNISESAVSRQVRILEDQLGISLFRRTHRGLEITDEGERLAVNVAEALDHIARATDPMAFDNNLVTIKAVPTFALRWLLPKLPEFKALHPEIKIVVQTRIEDMTRQEESADIGVRYGLGKWHNEDTTELYQEWITPVCGPDYFAGKSPKEALVSATLLHPLPDRQDWVTWAHKTGFIEDVNSGFDFDSQDMAISAAEAGIGVAIADQLLVKSAIENQRLVAPFKEAVPTGVSYYLVRRPELKVRRQVKAVEDWIFAEIEKQRP